MITAESLARRLAGLDGVGTGAEGVWRLSWTEEDAATRAWFERQAADVGLRVERDPAGNLWACPGVEPPWWGIGSHLDSVRGGGRFDGPLGVACAFEIAAGVAGASGIATGVAGAFGIATGVAGASGLAIAPHPVAVVSFADEEGARFNTPTFGSKALAGRLDLPAVLSRRDDAGVALEDAMRASGVDPARIADAPDWLERLSGFVEIHIDQTTDLARAGEPVGLVSALAARTRLEVVLRGRADHAGTTPRSERRDALAAAARLIVGAEELAACRGSDSSPVTVTTSRILAKPNAPTTIAAEVRLWIDARSAEGFGAIDAWRTGLDEHVAALSARTGVEIEIGVASRSDGREFSPSLRSVLARAGEEVLGHAPPEVVCLAGHDAGVLAERLPAAMVFVRNETGVSHSPAENLDLADAAVAARVVERALAIVASGEGTDAGGTGAGPGAGVGTRAGVDA